MKGVGARVPGWQGGRVADGRRHANGVGRGGVGVGGRVGWGRTGWGWGWGGGWDRVGCGVGLVKPGGFGVWAQLLLLLLQPSCECSYCSSQFPTGAGPLVPMAWHT